MAFEFKFPDVGEGIHEGEIVRWRVKVGDEVKEDQPLVEVETAKAIVELPSPRPGTVLALQGKEGQIIKVGDLLSVIGEKGEKWPAQGVSPHEKIQAEPAQKAKAGPGVVGEIPTEEKGVVLPGRQTGQEGRTTTGASVQQNILPRLRKLAADLGVDVNKVKGSGPGGEITEEDIRKGGAPDFSALGPIETIPLKGVRKSIAEHMVKSAFTIPHVTHMDECDVTELVKLRESKKPEAEKRGIKLTFLPFIIKATVEALKKHPSLNATLNEATQEIICKKYYNICIAVDAPDGLMLPVIKNADRKDIWQIAQEIVDLAMKCRDRKIDLKDLQGGSFSITNIGSVGGLFATPIISYGQTGNLGIFRIKEKPVVINEKIEIKPMLTLALSFDHRVVDGAEAARFMNDLINLLMEIK